MRERRRRSAETERQRLASLDGERELIADDDAHHRVTERTNVQQGKRHEDEYSIHSQINVYTISSMQRSSCLRRSQKEGPAEECRMEISRDSERNEPQVVQGFTEDRQGPQPS